MDPGRFFLACAHKGGLVKVRMPTADPYVVTDPALIEEVLVTRNRSFKKDRMTRDLRHVVGDGLLVSDGEFWRRQRRLAQPAFHRERIQAYGEAMVAAARRRAQSWREGQVRDIHADMMNTTLEIVSATLFSSEVGQRAAPEVEAALTEILARFSDWRYTLIPRFDRLPLAQNRRYDAAVARLDALVYQIIAERRASGERADDLLDMLMHARGEDGAAMSDRQLHDEVLILYLAGHETTALALSWAWLLLSRNPSAWERLGAELDAVLGDRDPTVADVPALPYCDAVIRESMRLYPPAYSVGREALEDVELGGFRIPAGSQIWILQWAVHRDPRWFPDPERFAPERWEEDLLRKLPRYAYFPFGGGPRLCIGNNFAMLEAVLVLATLARRFRPEVHRAPGLQFSITLRPRGGMHATITGRRPTARRGP